MICAPLLGRIADRLGRRLILNWCLVGFAVANLLTAMAPSFAWLLAARVFARRDDRGRLALSLRAGRRGCAAGAARATWMAMAVSGLLCSLSFGARHWER